MTTQELINQSADKSDPVKLASSLKKLTAQVVSAYLRNNNVPFTEIPGLIRDTYASLSNISAPSAAAPEQQRPAISVKKSVTPDAVTCLECGAELNMLKRHLKAAHNLTVDEYLTKWSLPSDYPMVAPNYGARRSEIAKEFGLGRKSNDDTPTTDSSGNVKRHQYPASRWSKPSE